MKKNLLLYILLAFLIVVNGIFLFMHFNKPLKRGGGQGPANFIVKELRFNESQLEKFYNLGDNHHENMKSISDKTKQLKDKLFSNLSNENFEQSKIDSLLNLIGTNEAYKDALIFDHLKSIQGICNEAQKKEFNAIVIKALHKNGKHKPRK